MHLVNYLIRITVNWAAAAAAFGKTGAVIITHIHMRGLNLNIESIIIITCIYRNYVQYMRGASACCVFHPHHH